MRKLVEDKIKELGIEASKLVEERENLIAMINELEVRIHQISGAISELNKLLDVDTGDKGDL